MSLIAERLCSHQYATSSSSTSSRSSCTSDLRPHLQPRRRARSYVVVHGERASKHRGWSALVTEPVPAVEFEAQADYNHKDSLVKTRFIAETLLPTRQGAFRLRGYKHSLDGGLTFTEPTAIICGQVEGLENVPVRVHDACFTSEVLKSLKCDCAEQLELALEYIQSQGCGMVIYLQQEGRGIGLANKIAAYALQEQGLDTVDANRALGLPDDCREYTSVRNILRDLQIRSVQLMTNNPRKMGVLTQLGVDISGRIPCQVKAGQFNESYLAAKRERMDHLLDGSWCYWNHDGEPTQPSATAYSQGGMGLPPVLKKAQDNSSSATGSLATHTVQLDDSDDEADIVSSQLQDSKSGSSNSSQQRPVIQVRLNGNSSKAGSSIGIDLSPE
eukprot:GHRR01003151.1.p1 GENE.GHRR01003151.1~~GHRR01003151.1.p1  ORF type:complete len:387 (+),score=84.67 GHRR01003151.1:205-1365(+)